MTSPAPEVGEAARIRARLAGLAAERASLTRGVYQEVVPHRRLVHTWRREGSDVESLVTVGFEPESAGRTRLTPTHSLFAEDEARDEHMRGWTGCLAKLEELWTG